ncbi:hypothetical protein P4O66_022576, partial [Electrophorus voltai]
MKHKRLQQAGKLLEENASVFNGFLVENDRNSALYIKNDISRNEELLKEYTTYQDVLLKLSPPEWQEKQRIRREMAESSRPLPRRSWKKVPTVGNLKDCEVQLQ